MSKKFKFWLNLFTALAILGLIIITRKQIGEAISKLDEINPIAILAMIPIQLMSYWCSAHRYRYILRSIDSDIKLSKMYRICLEMNFVNQVFPSGGLSGFSYLRHRLKQEADVPSSKSALTQAMAYFLMFFGIISYLFVGMLLLALVGKSSRLTVLIASTIISGVIFGAIVVIYIVSDAQRVQSFTAFLPKLINSILRRFRKGRIDTIDISKVKRLFLHLHDDYKVVAENRSELAKPLLWTMGTLFFEMCTIYSVYVAFGSWINPGALIIAYAVANIAGLISLLPGGVGVYESLMTAVLTSAGVPGGLAFSVTVVYRVLNMIYFLPIGYIFYHRALAKKDPE